MSATYWPGLPSLCVCLLIVAISSASLVTLKRSIYACVPSYGLKRFQFNQDWVFLLLFAIHGFAIGTTWMASVGHWYTSWQQEVSKFKDDVILTGDVLSVTNGPSFAKIVMKVKSVNDRSAIISPNVILYWYHSAIQLRRHQHIKVSAKLKPAYGLANPGSALKQQWLLSQAVVATGSITANAQPELLLPSFSFHANLSAFLDSRTLTNARWLKAILIGNRDDLSSDDWGIMQATGTAHLFSISGLHMGIIFAWCYTLFAGLIALWQKVLLRASPHYSASKWSLFPLLILTGSYAIIATGALPVVRAWVLISLYLILQYKRVHWSTQDKALIMMCLCLFVFPLSVYSASFYLSVGAVITIWFLLWSFKARTRTIKNKISQLILMQFMLCMMMLPMTMLWFGQISWIAPIANLVFVPLISFAMPFFLLALMVDNLFKFDQGGLLVLADDVMRWMIEFMTLIASFAPAFSTSMNTTPVALCLFIIVFLCLCPPLAYKRVLILLCLIPLITAFLPADTNSWKLHIFDVGQGTALAISQGHEALLIDTGAAFKEGSSMMRQVVIPALRSLNVNKVDTLFISHSDNDHAGGLADFIQYFGAEQGRDVSILSPASGCVAGEQWRWNALRIAAIWPRTPAASGNNFSCVLKVSGPEYSVLLPGDIESSAEYELLYQQPDLSAEILIAPHHGSNTSSTGIFVNAVSPQLVAYTTGFKNRWQFPAEKVVDRYYEIGATQFNTSEHGYIQMRLSEDGIRVTTFRDDIKKRWYLQQTAESSTFSLPLMY
nr:DNA internalization-related competence protein ComEC/Rec2 [Alteromonas ponticola]